MARMTMRTREAPMDWEREQDRNVPNVFSTPQPLLGTHEMATHSLAASSSLGSFSSETGARFPSRESSFGSQAPGMSRQGSHSWAFEQQDGTFSSSRPQSPASSGAKAIGSLGTIAATTTTAAKTSTSKATAEAAASKTARDKKNNTKTPFDMDILGNDVFDSPSKSTSGTRSSSLQQYRSRSGPWGDDDDDDDDDDNVTGGGEGEDDDGRDMELDSDDGRRMMGRSRSWNVGQDRQQRIQKAGYDQQGNGWRREGGRTRQQQHQQHQPATLRRSWSENVDLPFILSGYVQVAMNTVFVGVLIYIVANFITTIQSDVSSMSEALLQRERRRIENCRKDYFEIYRCNGPIGPALFRTCEDARACMEQPDPRIGRASVAAETFALIFNSFVNTISYKTMGFVMVIVFGGLYVSNHAISSYRSNHVMLHQHAHTVVSPLSPSGSGPGLQRINSNSHAGNSGGGSSSSRAGSLLSLQGGAVRDGYENSLQKRRPLARGGNAGGSGGQVSRRHNGSSFWHQHGSDDGSDHDVDMDS